MSSSFDKKVETSELWFKAVFAVSMAIIIAVAVVVIWAVVKIVNHFV